MPRRIILSLCQESDPVYPGITDHAQRVAGEVRHFGTGCLTGLTNEEIKEIEIIGHANTQIYGGRAYANFTETFDQALLNAGLEKTAVKKLNCIGCELGLVV